MKDFKKNNVPNIQRSLILSQVITNKFSCKTLPFTNYQVLVILIFW